MYCSVNDELQLNFSSLFVQMSSTMYFALNIFTEIAIITKYCAGMVEKDETIYREDH